jgi:hypothetical protein
LTNSEWEKFDGGACECVAEFGGEDHAFGF